MSKTLTSSTQPSNSIMYITLTSSRLTLMSYILTSNTPHEWVSSLISSYITSPSHLNHPDGAGANEDGAKGASERDGEEQCHHLLRPSARKPAYPTCCQMVAYKDIKKLLTREKGKWYKDVRKQTSCIGSLWYYKMSCVAENEFSKLCSTWVFTRTMSSPAN